VSSKASVEAIAELVLEVSDLESARHFYRDMLGLEETLEGESREGRYWYLIGDSARLGIWEPQVGLAGGRGGAHVHFALRVSEQELDRLAAVLTHRADVTGPLELGESRSIYVSDPDGNVVELWTQDMHAYAARARTHGLR
jgi:catechol-2,3-dioxygenase